MVTQVFTMKEFLGYVNNLPTKLAKGTDEINMEMATSLQRRIRFRAPSGSTGSLKQIKIEKTGKDIKLTGPGHWSYVNAGVNPYNKDGRFIPVEFFEMHQASPGSTAGRSAFISNPKGWVKPSFVGGKGFVTNSIEALRQDMPTIIERGLNKAFSK